MKFAGSNINVGIAYLFYEWAYLPLARHVGVEPWSLTELGLLMVGLGLVVGFVVAIVRWS